MGLDFSNLNSLWAGVMVETLARLGLQSAVICPGSRSTPLTVALARHPQIKTIPILDERSAAFFALGLAKSSGLPTVLVCTSGTAGANFYPAVIEAYQSAVPLIIFTGDRPPELRDCHSGQTIDQIKLFGNFAQWFSEMATPLGTVEMLRYARQTMVQAWRRSQFPQKGVVYLNCPFRDPLAPIADGSVTHLKDVLKADFFAGIQPLEKAEFSADILPTEAWKNYARGLIIAGVNQPDDPDVYCQAIAQLSGYLSFPVLTEALSPVRNYAHYFPQGLVITYDFILRDQNLAETLKPEIVIQIGALPTSKILRAWLEKQQIQTYILSERADNFDPLHRPHQYLAVNLRTMKYLGIFPDNEKGLPYLDLWQTQDAKIRAKLAAVFQAEQNLNEAAIAYCLARALPEETAIFFANSMVVRYAEFFWQLNDQQILPYFNRGANGIDGTLSTALGIAENHSPAVLLTGDLALLHDINGFLTLSKFTGSLTIIVINNQGGGIFEMLPIAEEKDIFEDYFATPQTVEFSKVCDLYGIAYQAIQTKADLMQTCATLPPKGVRLLEVKTNRNQAMTWLKDLFQSFESHF
ncbi:2-succinyl-5-enolpyruvyl-6-hydroxy-3-cyclohexene-1-carboxylic-acid synthase [Picosynechococcus sp. PCC 11901]|uniref:2-succinyl-5-enolpyruvyl-6-hydroxy-3- cyclohexene-1-carboxylic-acid synthase n=1 Tax=Picosynechococcus sp. PCC 11901 TaxID=2579791 RepID=UPI0010FC344D|nr:2-succinyl-5-enolpyruvyl-6-hydroxy-3-cyclohexene-1-carboxylic-acid synthase [Picosynechococcus sp. PCC 11901]QCS50085.1 2-succinyl-5-enolpyruvyl-6-hydroxy-3-cyclohexene-1-carboxylic-acid synthase [Picosynechococcus sp. PCC 11901]